MTEGQTLQGSKTLTFSHITNEFVFDLSFKDFILKWFDVKIVFDVKCVLFGAFNLIP